VYEILLSNICIITFEVFVFMVFWSWTTWNASWVQLIYVNVFKRIPYNYATFNSGNWYWLIVITCKLLRKHVYVKAYSVPIFYLNYFLCCLRKKKTVIPYVYIHNRYLMSNDYFFLKKKKKKQILYVSFIFLFQ